MLERFAKRNENSSMATTDAIRSSMPAYNGSAHWGFPTLPTPPAESFVNQPWNVAGGHNPQNTDGARRANHGYGDFSVDAKITGRPCKNNEHLLITVGDVVFTLKSPTQFSGVATTLSLRDLNKALKEGYEQNFEKFAALVKYEDSEHQGVKFLPSRYIFGTDLAEEWVTNKGRYFPANDNTARPAGSSRNGNGWNVERRIPLVLAKDPGRFSVSDIGAAATMHDDDVHDDENDRRGRPNATTGERFSALDALVKSNLENAMQEAREMHDEHAASLKFLSEKTKLEGIGGLKYLYGAAIDNAWNLFGICRTEPGGGVNYVESITGGGGTYLEKGLHGAPMGVIFYAKTHDVYNVWSGTICVGDVLWLILKRVKYNGNEWREYQYIPWTNGKDAPSSADISYVDVSGQPAEGIVYCIGLVSETMETDKLRSKQMRDKGCGLHRPTLSSVEGRYSIVGLDKLTIHFRAACRNLKS
jgi:hypothetical protein